MSEGPNPVVRALDDAWTSIGRFLGLPSATIPVPQPVVEPPPVATQIIMPDGRAARLYLIDVKGEYDFGPRSSLYKASLGVGSAVLKVKHDVLSNMGLFELEGPEWEVGYRHADKRIHAKKKWRLGKGLLFIVRQDIPQWNWARVPSPELQLEHEVKRVAGLDKHKLELKFDTFSQVSTIEEEARFGGCYKFKSSINSFSKLDGAKLALEAEYGKRFLDEVKIRYSRKAPLLLEYKMKPFHGIKLKAFADPLRKTVTGEVELQAEQDGMKIELQSFVSPVGWAKPRVQIGFKF